MITAVAAERLRYRPLQMIGLAHTEATTMRLLTTTSLSSQTRIDLLSLYMGGGALAIGETEDFNAAI